MINLLRCRFSTGSSSIKSYVMIQYVMIHQVLRTNRDDLIDELPVEKRHLSKLISICRI